MKKESERKKLREGERRLLSSKYVSLQHNFKLTMLIDTPILLNVSRSRYQTTFLLSIHRAPFCSSRLASFLAIGSPLVFLSCRYQDPIF